MQHIYVAVPLSAECDRPMIHISSTYASRVTKQLIEVTRNNTHILYSTDRIEMKCGTYDAVYITIEGGKDDNSASFDVINHSMRELTTPCKDLFHNDVVSWPPFYILSASVKELAVEIHLDVPEGV